MIKKRKMGNENKKEAKEDSLSANYEKEKLWEEEYNKVVAEATITGSTWEELSEKLSKHIEDTDQIEKEWEYLQRKDDLVTRNESLFKEALQPFNKPKNRYLNILPYDTTRVKLTPLEVVGTDYINANWVTSGERAYICTQAPLENTVEDFYRMLWETKARTLVMLTRFTELGRIKAYDYLPKVGEGPIKYGDLEVEVTSEEPSKDETYVIRKITITKGGEKHVVVQFHFLAWPDHGVPDDSEPLLQMTLTVDEMCPPSESTSKSPTVVHCSAGVGRTGTYVIINSILEQITKHMENNPNEPLPINMAKTVHDVRAMRSGMVNHIDQYEFCYKTILSHIQDLIKARNEKKTKEEKKE